MKYAARSNKDGSKIVYMRCRKCNNERARKYYSTPNGKKNIYKAIQKSESTRRGIKRREAYEKVKWAVKSGKLVRPESCPVCEKKCVVQAHHHDYSKPLEIEWLCAQCHADEHKTS